MGHEGRAGVKDGKDGDEDDQVDVSCFPDRKTAQHCTEKTPTSSSAIGDVMRRGRLRWHGNVERKDDADYVKTCTRLVVEGNLGRLFSAKEDLAEHWVCRHTSAER